MSAVMTRCVKDEDDILDGQTVDDGLFAADAARLAEANVIRTQRTLDDLELRLRIVEQSPGVRLTRPNTCPSTPVALSLGRDGQRQP